MPKILVKQCCRVYNVKNFRRRFPKFKTAPTLENFVAQHDDCQFLNQNIFNYCFTRQRLNFPVRYNIFVKFARKSGDVTSLLYHFVL
ncbi:MAG: hypothetical protein IJU91_02010 [Selenomonadaceae bacterium]|nr:hypothetical protein [Selenomonadaceae bacterium]